MRYNISKLPSSANRNASQFSCVKIPSSLTSSSSSSLPLARHIPLYLSLFLEGDFQIGSESVQLLVIGSEIFFDVLEASDDVVDLRGRVELAELATKLQL